MVCQCDIFKVKNFHEILMYLIKILATPLISAVSLGLTIFESIAQYSPQSFQLYSSNPNCRFGPGFFWQSGFDGLNWYLFVVSILFPLKYWHFPCLGLRQLIIKSNAAAAGQSVCNWTIFGYFCTYSHDNLGQEIIWYWCSVELVGLLVIVIGSYSGVVEIDNGCSANLLSWVSDISKSTFPISLDNRETSANVGQVGSLTLLDKNEERGWCSGSDSTSYNCSFSVVIFWSLMLVPSSIFSFWLVALFFKLELFFNTAQKMKFFIKDFFNKC